MSIISCNSRPARAIAVRAAATNPTSRLLLMTALGLTLLAVARPALAHDALPTAAKPQGWSYPFSCCSGFDCREVSAQAISERPDGYQISYSGEVVAYSDTRIKNSPDGEYHWCSVQGADDGKTICLFVPPPAY
jgi:hypothetical protein